MLKRLQATLQDRSESDQERLERLARLEAAVAVVLRDFSDPVIVSRYLTTLLEARSAPLAESA